MGLGRQRHVHYNKVLTNYAVSWPVPSCAAREVLLEAPVENHSDVYPVFDRDWFNEQNDLRASGAPSHEIDFGWTYQPYLCEKRALKTWITDDERRNWDSEVDIEVDATERVKEFVWQGYERRVFGTGGLMRTAANFTGSANKDWTNLSSADIKSDLNTAIEAVEVAAGVTPNCIVLARDVGRHIANTAQWKEYYKYTQMIADEDAPSTIYGLRAIYVESLVNANKKGQAKSAARVMSDDVAVVYINPGGFGYKTLTYGATFKTYEETRSWFDKERNATAIEYEAEFVGKLVAKECGYLFTSVRTA